MILGSQNSFDQALHTIDGIGHNILNARNLAIILGVFLFTFLVNRILSWAGSRVVRVIVNQTERAADNSDKLTRYRRAETSLNVVLAIINLIVISFAFYIIWRLLSPATAPAAAVGAGALFIVLAGGTIGPLLHDITSGSVMIAERWYGVGDYITVEPFSDVAGVVERLTLRSTKLRGLSGEVVWMHNQHIQAVKVKYRGVTSIALDVFVRDKQRALKLLGDIVAVVPKGPMLVVGGLEITEIEELSNTMWRIELSGKTVPGREWLIEKFAAEAIKDADEQANDDKRIIVYGPIARYVDQTAERRFKRAIK